MFLLHLALVLFQFGLSSQSERILRGTFNMRLMCGKFLGATGRLQMKFIANTLVTSKESIVFDTVLAREDNGYFIKNVTAKMDLMQALNPHEFQLKFRTNCFIMNRIGECCVHDFIFYGRTVTGQEGDLIQHKWFETNFSLKNTVRKLCEDPKNDYSDCRYARKYGRNCLFSMSLANPKATNDHNKHTIDLVDLLVDMENSAYDKFFDGKHTWLQVKRICAPADGEMTNEGNGQMWPICEPIRYGHLNNTNEKEQNNEQRLLQEMNVSAYCPHGTRSGCEPCD